MLENASYPTRPSIFCRTNPTDNTCQRPYHLKNDRVSPCGISRKVVLQFHRTDISFYPIRRTNTVAKVTFIVGLAGSGKSFYAERLSQATGATIFEGTEGNKAVKEKMLAHLANGGSCIVEEIAYCLPSRREAIVSNLCAILPEIEIEWICFENDMESANWNVKHRRNKEDARGHLRINQCYYGLYIYPGGATVLPIVRCRESKN